MDIEKADRDWQRVIEVGQQIVERGQNVKWDLGDLAVAVCKRWQRSNKTLIALAGEIKLERARAIYEYHEVAEYFPKSARRVLLKDCPFLTWSHFRAARRYANRTGAPREHIIELLVNANTNMRDVEQFEEDLRNNPQGDWMTMRKRIVPIELTAVVTDDGRGYVAFYCDKADVTKLLEVQNQPEFKQYLALAWAEQRVKEPSV